MTNAIEQSKREMYEWLGSVKRLADSQASAQAGEMLENCLEIHLELLRQDLSALHETARKRFEDIQSLEAVSADLAKRLTAMTANRDEMARSNLAGAEAYSVLKKDRDNLRNRMQAYEARESQASTSGQSSAENASCSTLDGKTAAILGAVVDVRQIVSDWAIYGYKAKKQMKKLAYAINNNPELHAAMLEFEKGDGYGTWFINNTACMHSFHPAFPSGEQCVFCGVGK